MISVRAVRAVVIAAAMIAAALIASAQPSGPPRPGPGSGNAGSGSAGSGSADDDDDDDDDPGAGSGTPDLDRAPHEGLAALDQHRAIPTGFDHLTHDRDLVVENKDSPPCSTCHPQRGKGELVGRPDHRACFGACHGAAPVRGKKRGIDPGERAKVCAACHAPTALIRASKGAGRLTVVYPPYALEPDFGIRMSHAAHAAAPCTTCHPTTPKPRTGPVKRAPGTVHQRCVGCHDKQAAPPMSSCTICHVAAFGTASSPTQLAPVIPVVFEHAAHARKTPKAACTACHAAITEATSTDVPRPTGPDCATSGCHDGHPVFAVTVACTKCHRDRPREWKVYRSENRFSHDNHVERLGTADCSSCHRLGRSGDAVTIGHTACDAGNCHAGEFMARDPEICQSCHVGSEPWRNLTEDQQPLAETEHGALMPHDRHRQPCTRCHSLASGGREKRPPRGHVACTGAGCHVADKGPTPRLVECEKCHRAGLVDARNRLRLDARWSARARFRHAIHATDPRTAAALGCETCHDAVAASTSMADIPTPGKPACAGCHDGAIAFKVTGTGCARCHGKPRP